MDIQFSGIIASLAHSQEQRAGFVPGSPDCMPFSLHAQASLMVKKGNRRCLLALAGGQHPPGQAAGNVVGGGAHIVCHHPPAPHEITRLVHMPGQLEETWLASDRDQGSASHGERQSPSLGGGREGSGRSRLMSEASPS